VRICCGGPSRRHTRRGSMSCGHGMFSLEGRIAVVTGPGRGIGFGIAQALAGAGADIVAGSRGPPEALAAEIERRGGACDHLPADLANADEVDTVIPRALAATGRVDIVVNNAGVVARGPAVDMSPADWHRVMQVNLHAVVTLCQAAAKDMLPRKRGKIINIASMMSFEGGILVSAYAASKGAVS